MVDERRQRVAERLGHEHVAHRSEVAVAEGTGSLALAQRDRAKTGAQVLAEISSLAESERDNGENRLASMIVEPVLHRVGQQARDTSSGEPLAPEFAYVCNFSGLELAEAHQHYRPN